MTAAVLLADLRARGVRLAAVGARLRVEAPRGVLTEADREALAAHKTAVLAELRDDGWADGVPDGPCGLCGGVLAWVRDWPTAGDARWLCPTCAAWPAPRLADVFAQLRGEERQRLEVDAARGDAAAVAVLHELRGSGDHA